MISVKKYIIRIERESRADPNGTAKGVPPLLRPSFASALSGPNGGFRLLPLNRGETPAARHSTKVHWPALAAGTDRDRTLSVESLPVAPTLSPLAESFSSFLTDTQTRARRPRPRTDSHPIRLSGKQLQPLAGKHHGGTKAPAGD